MVHGRPPAWVAVLCLCALAAATLVSRRREALEAPDAGAAIANGRAVPKGRYPFIGHTFCWGEQGTCFLIDPLRVLTAGHVARTFRDHLSNGRVYLGGVRFDNSDAVEVHQVASVVLNPGYRAGRYETDWGVLVLKAPSKLPPVRVDGLNADVTSADLARVGNRAWHAGFGMTRGSPGLPGFPEVMQESATMVQSRTDALVSLFVNEATPGFSTPYRTPCVGDSGSPLMVSKGGQWVAVGIVVGDGSKDGTCFQTAQQAGYQRQYACATRQVAKFLRSRWSVSDSVGYLAKHCNPLAGRVRTARGTWKCPASHRWDAGVWDQPRNPAGWRGKQCGATALCALNLYQAYVANGAGANPPRYA